MKEPTNETINRRLAEFMGKVSPDCNHYWDESQPDWLEKCEYCGFERPDYTSSDSPRRLLEEVVAKVSSPPDVNAWRKLAEVLITDTGDPNPWIDKFLTATAEQIARACYAVIEENKERESMTDEERWQLDTGGI